MNGYHWRLKRIKSFRAAVLPHFGGLLLGHERSDMTLARRKNEGRRILYTTASLSHSLQLVSWTGIRRQDWVQTGRTCQGEGAGGQIRVCSERLVGPAESSWAPRAASFCWAAPLVPIQSWSRTRRRKRTLRSLCGLCTGCCQRSSLSGADCFPWPSQGHELRQQPQREKDKNKNTTPTTHCTLLLKDFIRTDSSCTHPAAPTAHSASLGRRCLAGGCGFFASCTGCTRWLCLESVLGKPVWQSSVSKNFREPWSNAAVSTSGKTWHAL